MQVVETLRELADRGKTVIAVIHQPSQHAFAMFDDLLLLSEGKQMYFGPINHVRAYLEQLGYAAPKEMGTAEHVLECIAKVSSGGPQAEQESLDRIHKIAEKAASAKIALPVVKDGDDDKGVKHYAHKSGNQANIFRQFQLLLMRSLHEAFRAKGAIIIKIVQQVSLGIVYGGIYQLGNNQVRERSIERALGWADLVERKTSRSDDLRVPMCSHVQCYRHPFKIVLGC
jgi:hypothetical protein